MTTNDSSFTDEDVAAIRALKDPWTQACLDRDWDSLLGICTSNVTLLPPDATIAEGTSASRVFLEAFPKIISFAVEFLNIDGRGDLATARGAFSMTAEIEGREVSMNGKFVDTFRKQEDGTWRYHDVCWNTDAPTA